MTSVLYREVAVLLYQQFFHCSNISLSLSLSLSLLSLSLSLSLSVVQTSSQWCVSIQTGPCNYQSTVKHHSHTHIHSHFTHSHTHSLTLTGQQAGPIRPILSPSVPSYWLTTVTCCCARLHWACQRQQAEECGKTDRHTDRQTVTTVTPSLLSHYHHYCITLSLEVTPSLLSHYHNKHHYDHTLVCLYSIVCKVSSSCSSIELSSTINICLLKVFLIDMEFVIMISTEIDWEGREYGSHIHTLTHTHTHQRTAVLQSLAVSQMPLHSSHCGGTT